MEKELHLGIMTNQELADWLGISSKTFSNQKKKRLEELKEYAVFEETKGKVEIQKILIPVYVKKDKQFEIVKSHIDETWAKNGLDTKINVSKQIYSKRKEYGITVSQTTNYSYVCKGSNQLYGNPRVMGVGEIGRSRYTLCVWDTETETARWFTKEEYQIREDLRNKYFSSKNSAEIQDQKEALYKQEKNGELTRKEVAEIIHDLERDIYFEYLEALEKALGENKLVYRTYVQRGYFWGEKVDVVD